jgi:phospholipid/cholesterol/gamma-HCH transport system substrate-binding protein
MISRAVRIQLIAFAALSLLGVMYVGVGYVGIGDRWLGRSYVVNVDLAVAGGIFPNASVTYRGVPIGRVSTVALRGDGVRVGLRLDSAVRVPSDLTATVAQRSAVGEQYLDLRPRTDAGPYLRDGDTITRDRTATPLPVETLLAGLDSLVESVGVDNVAVVIDELGRALAGNEDDLRRILDASNLLLADTQRHLPETLTLLRDGQTVLTTQAESAQAIRRWASSLAQLADTVRAADPDLRRIVAEGPPAALELGRLLRGLDPTVGTLLGNLITVNNIAVRRLDGIEQILVVYPIVVSGSFTVAPGDGTAHFGLVVNVGDPPSCNYTASGTAGCTAAEQAGGSNVRGSAAAPRAGPGQTVGEGSGPALGAQPGPATTAAAGPGAVAGFDPATGLVVGSDHQPLAFGGTGGQYELAGDQSWKQLLLSGVAP